MTAEDVEGNSTTETISIAIKDINVHIIEDEDDPVVSIKGEPDGVESLTIDFDSAQDPDIAGDDHPVLVVYTWSIISSNDDFATETEAVFSVSSSAQPFVLDTETPRGDGLNNYVGMKIKATVQYYEVDPVTGAISVSKVYDAVTDVIELQDAVAAPTSVSFDVTTDGTGLAVVITATGEAREDSDARLEVSTNRESGWIVIDRAEADTSGEGGMATITLDVDANGDGEGGDATEGDGGGLHYRVVYVYDDEDGDSQTEMSKVVQLGSIDDPNTSATVTNIISATTPAVGETIRVDTDGADAVVQWQERASATMPWMDIDGAKELELKLGEAQAGMMLRATVKYTADDDPDTTDVDEEGWPIWLEYTEMVTVAGDTGNTAPEATQASDELRVELDQKSSAKGAVQNAEIATFDASSLFFDSDGDDLTYTITGSPATALDGVEGFNATLELGGSVFLSETVTTAEDTTTDPVTPEVTDFQQSFSIDQDTGMVTYITDREQSHDGVTTDGTGNTLTFTISATDNGMVNGSPTTAATATVEVRVNVTPTAINLQSVQTDGTTIGTDPVALTKPPTPPAKIAGIALLTDDGDDTDTDPDELTFIDDEEYDRQKVANLDVMDQNLNTDKFGTHKITFSGKGANMFEARETRDDDDDNDGSTWELWLKDDATFDYEALATAAEKKAGTPITLYITVTATDEGGLSTKGVFKVMLEDAKTKDDPDGTTTTTTDDPDPEVPGLEDDADDRDNDGPVIPPDDGGAFIGDDLLDDFVAAIDDIDVA